MPARSYGDLAKHYKVFVGARGCEYEPWVKWLITAAAKHGITGKRALSLGCGNCLAETDLARRGFDVTGVDSSSEMLKQARKEARGSGIRLRLVHADIRDYSAKTKYDLVFSHYYTINYITTLAGLRRCFCNVHGSMDTGGLFVFDTKYVTRDASGDGPHDAGTIYYVQDSLHTILTRKRLKNNVVHNDYTNFFFSGKKGLYEMSRELHRQRFFRADEFERALLSAGFQADGIAVYRYLTFSPSLKERDRVVFVCRKA